MARKIALVTIFLCLTLTSYSYLLFSEINSKLISLNKQIFSVYKEIPPIVSNTVYCVLKHKKNSDIDFQLAKPLAGYSLSVSNKLSPDTWYTVKKYYATLLISRFWKSREERLVLFLALTKYRTGNKSITYGFAEASKLYFQKNMDHLTEDEVEQIILASYAGNSSPLINKQQFHQLFSKENLTCETF